MASLLSSAAIRYSNADGMLGPTMMTQVGRTGLIGVTIRNKTGQIVCCLTIGEPKRCANTTIWLYEQTGV